MLFVGGGMIGIPSMLCGRVDSARSASIKGNGENEGFEADDGQYICDGGRTIDGFETFE